jgi:hypothetical protein
MEQWIGRGKSEKKWRKRGEEILGKEHEREHTMQRPVKETKSSCFYNVYTQLYM